MRRDIRLTSILRSRGVLIPSHVAGQGPMSRQDYELPIPYGDTTPGDYARVYHDRERGVGHFVLRLRGKCGLVSHPLQSPGQEQQRLTDAFPAPGAARPPA